MIKGISPALDLAGARPSENAKTKATDSKESGFAEQLLGARSERLNGADRNERKISGRDSNREDSRSNEREQISRESSDPRAQLKAKQLSRAKKGASNPSSDREPTMKRSPAQTPEADYYAPIRSERVRDNESPVEGASVEQSGSLNKGPLSQTRPGQIEDVRLPDFFSKSALMGDTGAIPRETQASADSASILGMMKQEEQIGREESMAAFLMTMESELGIPPEKIMASFAMMDDTALNSAPEASIGEFVSNLELLPGQEARAEELYRDLLSSTGDSILSEKLIGLESGVNFSVMSPRDARLKQLDSSLTQMNDSFFNKNGLSQEPEKAQVAIEAMDAELNRLMRGESLNQEPQADDSTLAMMGLGAGAASASDLGSTSAMSTSGLSAGDGGFVAGMMSSGANSSASWSGSDSSSMADSSSQKFADQTASSAKNEASFSNELKETAAFAPEAVSTETLSGSAPLASSQAPVASSLAQGAMAGGPSAMMLNRQPTADDEQANVRELIKQAQVALKKGGGEMKLEMTPEGMGQVHLKVAVENGQVNVQMLTESESAKRLLEKGIGELKTSLAAQQLNVEKVSVDVGQEISKQMDQQANQEQARDQARQQAQAFMGQFRDERQGFRQGMFDQSGFKHYGRGQNRPSVEPEAIAQASTSSRAQKADGSRRLNVVA